MMLTTQASALGLLEWVPSQQLLVSTAKFGWLQAYRTMLGELAPQSKDGDYVRPAPQTGTKSGLELKDRRYRVYLGNACPWCHRVALGLALRETPNVKVVELEDDATKASRGGWIIKTMDPVFGKRDLKQVYDAATGGAYEGRCTAPLLVDEDSKRIISQESGDILRALCDLRVGNDLDLRPPHLATNIDDWNDLVYRVNDGCYKCGFATKQTAYERAYKDLHDALNHIETSLSTNTFLLGEKLTEADLRLYPTIARYDAVYASLFRCGGSIPLRYPHINRWRLTMLALPGVDASFDAAGAAKSYYSSLFPLNPSGIVPVFSPSSSSSPPPVNIDDVAFSFHDRPSSR